MLIQCWPYRLHVYCRFNPPCLIATTTKIFFNFTQKFVGYIYEDKKGNIWPISLRAYDQTWSLSRYDEKSLSNNKATGTSIFPQNMALFNNKATATEITNKPMIFGILEDDKEVFGLAL